MLRIATLAALALLATARADDGPKKPGPRKSADVVEVKLERFTIADGLEPFFVTVRVAKCWQVYANPAGAKAVAGSATAVELFIDGKPTSANDVYYPKGAARKGAAGETYRAYEGAVTFTAWLRWDDTRDATVITARVKVTATDGKRRLKASVVTAEAR
jgi:hypothetical protein